uniref:Uncharacterized protein n=1 Tax=Anguilla anguilla TaxID=7936 RepID=A0A0E9WII3_ANGAN
MWFSNMLCLMPQFAMKLEHHQHLSVGGILFYCILIVHNVRVSLWAVT